MIEYIMYYLFDIYKTNHFPVAQLKERPLWGTGGRGFEPLPGHTKVYKMTLAAPRLASISRGRAKTRRPGASFMKHLRFRLRFCDTE